MNRLREIDFLRGVAILLVLLRHVSLISFTTRMGWIGVDLFFVLSGFLVSGLLFKEYLKFGSVDPKLFLIRRGFKIYPIYYLFYLPYLALILVKWGHLSATGILSDLTFTQNYTIGWGYAYAPSWSLALEEHFYFGFTLVLWLGLKFKWFDLSGSPFNLFTTLIFTAFGFCFGLRFMENIFSRPDYGGLFSQTHLRIDSLLMGVCISYYYHFHCDDLSAQFKANKKILITIACLGLCWTPFIEPTSSFFAKTIGFTLLYLSFGIILLLFLFGKNINATLNKLFTKNITNLITRIGYCSYSIYIIHSLVITLCEMLFQRLPLKNGRLADSLFFLGATSLSIMAGMLMTFKVEKYFLGIRNRYFPGRIQLPMGLTGNGGLMEGKATPADGRLVDPAGLEPATL